ncbi:hypothetical protein F4803DRAFT_549387 [Xylaria telfairii]|nr:hypothetical protein F4803DRAFT_549387 [Xylaria telfairii]
MSKNVTVAQIAPSLEINGFSVDIFGTKSHGLQTPTNSLLFSSRIKGWFDNYNFVIVPVDYSQTPIRRWRIELIGNSIANTAIITNGAYCGKYLDGREPDLLSENRPALGFLYFHFIMALVRIRDIDPEGWKGVWARYLTQKPFPTPGNYVLKHLLITINQHFQTTDMEFLEAWISGLRFERPITPSKEEAARVAKRL